MRYDIHARYGVYVKLRKYRNNVTMTKNEIESTTVSQSVLRRIQKQFGHATDRGRISYLLPNNDARTKYENNCSITTGHFGGTSFDILRASPSPPRKIEFRDHSRLELSPSIGFQRFKSK